MSSAQAEPRYPTLHVEVDEDRADLVSGWLFELGATGVEERDQSTFIKGPTTAGRVLLVASFEDHAAATEASETLVLNDPALAPRIEEIVGDAWRDEWKKYYEPFALTPTVTVRPPWHEAPSGATNVLVLEPGRAFGTGLHATTSLVANILDGAKSELAGTRILDAGCGSGILSFVALLLGAEHAVAFDIDPEVVHIVQENAAANAMSDRVDVFAGTLDRVKDRYPWVLANIEAKILDPLAEDLARVTEPGGCLVLSGILLAEEDRMKTRFDGLSAHGVRFELVETRRTETGGERAYDKDGWVALRLRAQRV
ncbi:MAG: methyltransferase domain-containing protein [Polyangiaceae bacterium]|nr:methyltransferase domain-containing protein [Polyangiaceae bacterium]